MNLQGKTGLYGVIVAVVIAAAAVAYFKLRTPAPKVALASGNGRIEATEINVAPRMPGRIIDVLAREGDAVTANQPLVHMQTDVLDAQRSQAEAQRQQAVTGVATAQAQVAMRRSDQAAADAQVVRAAADLDASQRRLARSETLSKEGASSIQELDDDRARTQAARAAVDAARAQAVAARSAVQAAQSQVVSARSAVDAAASLVARIDADIRDSTLSSPRDGRVQYRVSEPGEVVAAGAPVLNVVDLSDVYMTFFLPETVAGRVPIGAEARIILDASPSYVIPARVSYVASVAQFTPKTVETATERQKLMFRVRANIDRDLLLKHLALVKTGLPGVAWVKLDPQAPWPPELAVRVP